MIPLVFFVVLICQIDAVTIYSFNFDSAPPDNWTVAGSILQENINCPSTGICWDIKGNGNIQRTISLIGFHTVSIQIDVAQNGLTNSNDYCQMEYNDSSTNDWSNPVFRYRSSTPIIGQTHSLPNDSTINNQSIFLFRLRNTGTNSNGDHCYFDNLVFFGTMYPTANPTTSPTIIPTNNPTLTPTFNPTNNPTWNPTDSTAFPTLTPSSMPTISPTFTDGKVVISTAVTDNEVHSEEQMKESSGIDYIIIILIAIVSTLIVLCIIGLFCYHYKRTKANRLATMGLDNTEKDIDLVETKVADVEMINTTTPKTENYIVNEDNSSDGSNEELFNQPVSTTKGIENDNKNETKQQPTTGNDIHDGEPDEDNELYAMGNTTQTTTGNV